MAVFLLLAWVNAFAGSPVGKIFVIQLADVETGRGIPMVELELENGLRLVSDNDGVITIAGADLFGHQVRFKVKGHGYHTGTKDFWGQQSLSLQIREGATARIELQRKFAAERLYRITGMARFNHSLLAGRTPSFLPAAEISGKVIGQDSLICMPHQGRLWLFYGDTLGLTGYNFSASCATLPMPDRGTYDPEIGLPLEYLVDAEGFAKKMIETGKSGFTWIEYVLPVETARKSTLLAKYVQHATLDRVAEAGFALFNNSKGNFEIVKSWPGNRHHRCTHPVPVKFSRKNAWLLFPWEICGESVGEIMAEERHWYFSCLEKAELGKTRAETFEIEGQAYKIRKNKQGKVVYQWQKGGPAADFALESRLSQGGLLKPCELLFAPIVINDGERLGRFTGSIVYNQHLKRWIMINQGRNPGDIIFAQADTPTGPWAFASKICEFDDYNFYNPIIHPWFDKNRGKTIFFEGTFTNFFSKSAAKVPEADYNQVMYKLELDHESLVLPIPVYRMKGEDSEPELLTGREISARKLWPQVESIEFFAFSSDAVQPDLLSAKDDSGQALPFKILRSDPHTEWGKNWLSAKSRHFGLEQVEIGSKKAVVIKVPELAQTWSADLEPGDWLFK